MRALVVLHVATGAAVVVLATACGVWGLWRSRTGAPRPSPRSQAAWRQLTAAWQTLVAACGVAGLALLARHHHRHLDPLHVRVYGPFMAVAILGAYSFRTADGRWNVRVMAVAACFVAALGVRALFTGY